MLAKLVWKGVWKCAISCTLECKDWDSNIIANTYWELSRSKTKTSRAKLNNKKFKKQNLSVLMCRTRVRTPTDIQPSSFLKQEIQRVLHAWKSRKAADGGFITYGWKLALCQGLAQKSRKSPGWPSKGLAYVTLWQQPSVVYLLSKWYWKWAFSCVVLTYVHNYYALRMWHHLQEAQWSKVQAQGPDLYPIPSSRPQCNTSVSASIKWEL